MKLEHSFTVPTNIDDAWKILLDIERIGPCMPGATVESVDGDDFTGSVKVKLGPIGLTYKGKASFVEKDEAAHRAVIDARGRDARGNGTAAAKVTATLSAQGDATHVQVDTDLDITGKPAQFGRGVMADVGNKLIGQFADNLAAEIQGDGDAAGSEAARSDAAGSDEGGAAPAAAAASAAGPSTESAAGSATPPSGDEAAAAAEAGAAGTASSDGAAGAAPAAVNGANGSSNGAAAAALSGPVGTSSTPATSRPAPKKAAPQREVEPINLLESAGPAVAKRLAPVVAVVALVVGFLVWRRRR